MNILDEELLEQIALADIHCFLELYNIKNEVGIPLDFQNHPFLWDIFCDLSPKQAIRKAAQVGFTTTAIIKSFWLAKSRQMDIIYTMPTYSDVKTLVTSKVDRIIDQNPVLQEWVSKKDTIGQKSIGNSMIYYDGTWSERDALSKSSDLNIHDEVDRSNLKVIEQYHSRLQHSKYGYEWMFSNPSVPNVGVDNLWNLSDQKHWFIQCKSCQKQQFLTMKNIFEGKDFNVQNNTGYYFGCFSCKTELPRYKGKWVKRWPKSDVSGYWISLLMCPWVSADEIKKLQREKPADYFDNFVLGVPHIGSGNTVTKDIIIRNLTDDINRQEGRIVIGVDPGIDIRYVIGNRQGLFHYGSCKTYRELEHFMNRWPKAIMVIDQGGDIIGPRELRAKYKNRVFLARYRNDVVSDNLFSWDDTDGIVTIQRNNTIQLLIDEFTDSRIPLYGTENDWYDYWVHWSHIYRTIEEDNFGRPRYKWVRSDRDDYVHATNYWRAGMDRFMTSEGTIINITETIGNFGYTATPDGKNLFIPKQTY